MDKNAAIRATIALAIIAFFGYLYAFEPPWAGVFLGVLSIIILTVIVWVVLYKMFSE